MSFPKGDFYQNYKRNMRKLILILLVLGALSACQSNEAPVIEEAEASSDVVLYDSLKAIKYGADDYGMKTYVMAFLKKGANRDLDSTYAVELQMAHLKNITRMAEEGKLVVAGPFLGDGDLRGVYIFDTPSVETAEEWTATDPAIQAGSLAMELQQWYGSAALVALNEVHRTLQKVGITD